MRFENVFELSPVGIALVSLDEKWLRVNRSLCDILGYLQQELLTLNFQSITHPDDLEADLNHVRELLNGASAQCEMEKASQSTLISQVQNISERKQNEERLRSSESVIINANDAILISEAEPIDQPGTRIVYANEAFLKTTGYKMEKV